MVIIKKLSARIKMLSNLEANEKLTAEITSMISTLECSGCGEICSSNEINISCPYCQILMLARNDLASFRNRVNRDAIRHRP
jgi:Zn finger protein HypA/HybF involved in hydrogenase expression